MFSHKVNEDTQLRLLEVRDADQLFALLDQSRSYLREWLPFVDGTRTVQDIECFIQSGLQKYASNNGVELGIWYRGELAGVLGLHYINWSHRLTSVGYWIGERFQGNGIMTNSCRTLIDILFKEYELNRVEIRVAPQNLKSRAIPERLGFQNEGCRRQAEWLYDHYVDHIIYGMLVHDWKVGF
ncbi:GCN5-like N-acetyltransferase [Alicyclobacillus hesperidum URH17-3-68]|uniref:GNAT family N-acetyltransferase n=1 Tax=Alicyclobacillus hesperidum TaxID=89784 RepID=A0A1H2VMF5_9BACL|nr:GNAT family protein [Alicyclobacillus hesperidum]EJY55698.1 GCN5-like N-acetyltransferase [Alicyclobacillus hesperidum URH17-3-68]GLV12970.1 GNAT family N-acetyltransferase [Alicyclobacillus hesperidum]SDW69565.1 ribosomal-protein-serine acetyltransferase [Alicyclobacillus hesperidum]